MMKNGTKTLYRDADGRQIYRGDKLKSADGHNYHIDQFGNIVDVADCPVDIKASSLKVTRSWFDIDSKSRAKDGRRLMANY